MKNQTPNKKLISLSLLVCGVLFLLVAVGLVLKKTNNKPAVPEQSLSTPTDTPKEDTTNKPITPPAFTGELSAVHGKNNEQDLTAIPKEHTQKDEKIHKAVYQPLMALINHAKQDGIRLLVVSAYRSYDRQKSIWERKWGDAPDDDTEQALKVLEYSSFPGTSRHHWGTDIDFNSVSLSYWQSDEGRKVHRWLTKNAPQYGFCQTYGDHRQSGYAVEDWHWSHMPTANRYYDEINNPQVLAVATNQAVKGATAVQQMDSKLYEYIKGISPCNDVNMGQFTTVEPPTQPAKPKVSHPTTQETPPTATQSPQVSGQGGSF